MSTPTIENVAPETYPAPSLPSALTSRIIFRLAHAQPGEAFDLTNAGEFAKALHGGAKGRSDYTVGVFEGKYIIDFPATSALAAVKRIGTVLFNGFERDYGRAQIEEVRIAREGQNVEDMQPGEAWVHMTPVTGPADKLLEHHRGELIADAASRIFYTAVFSDSPELQEPSPALPL